MRVWTYRGREEEGGVTFFTDRPVRIYLNAARPRPARDWVRHILHELAHAYFDARQDPGYFEREERAERFAARALEAWR